MGSGFIVIGSRIILQVNILVTCGKPPTRRTNGLGCRIIIEQSILLTIGVIFAIAHGGASTRDIPHIFLGPALPIDKDCFVFIITPHKGGITTGPGGLTGFRALFNIGTRGTFATRRRRIH